MAKTKNKERSELEYFRGKIKRLETENRQLKKRVNSLDKREHYYDCKLDEVEEEAEETPQLEKCKECGKGEIKVLDLKHIVIETCTICDYRKRL